MAWWVWLLLLVVVGCGTPAVCYWFRRGWQARFFRWRTGWQHVGRRRRQGVVLPRCPRFPP